MTNQQKEAAFRIVHTDFERSIEERETGVDLYTERLIAGYDILHALGLFDEYVDWCEVQEPEDNDDYPTTCDGEDYLTS